MLNAMRENAPNIGTNAVWMVCTINANVTASVPATPYKTNIVFTARCHAPAPLGVGTMTDMLPTMKLTMAAEKLSCSVKPKHLNVIQ